MEKNQLASLFLSLRQRLRAVAAPIVGEAEADDTLQEAFCRLWQRSDEIADRQMAEGMSIVTVRRLAIDEVRRRAKCGVVSESDSSTPSSLSSPSAPSSQSSLSAQFEEIRSLIFSEMDSRQAEILWRRDYQQWDFQEIADEYGLSEANVRKIVSRARKEIREIYRRKMI